MRISDWSSDVCSSDLCFLHVSTGSAGSCHLQAARAECRSILAHVYHLAQRADASHMRLMLIETESTPNPATLKFLPGRPVMEAGTRDFASPEEAAASPLATALFTLGDVTGVFFGRDFVSVTIAPGAEWADAKGRKGTRL